MKLLLIFSLIVVGLGFIATCPDVDSTAKYFCGSCLSDTLHQVCGERGYVSHFTSRLNLGQRGPSGIVEECCRNPCTKHQLKQYCQGHHRKFQTYTRKRSRKSPSSIIKSNMITNHKRKNSFQVASCQDRPYKKSRRNGKRSTRRQNVRKYYEETIKRVTTENPLSARTPKLKDSPQAEFHYVEGEWMDGNYFDPSHLRYLV